MRIKKIFFAAGVLLLTAMTGCGKESLKTIMTDTQKNVKEISSASGDIDMDLEMKIGQSGVSMGIDMGLEGDWETVSEPASFHFDGELNISLMKFSMDIELYGIEEDGKMILYTKAADKWSRTESKLEDSNSTGDAENLFDPDSDRVILDDKIEKMGDKEVYVLHTTVTGEDIKNVLKAVEEVTDESLDKIDLSSLDVEVTARVYKEDKLPASVTVDLKDGLSNLIPEDDPSGVQAGIEKCVVIVNTHDYNKISAIEIPQEALEAENLSGGELIQDLEQGITSDNSSEENDDMDEDDSWMSDDSEDENNSVDDNDLEEPEKTEDGSYVLTDYEGNERAYVKAPEGFEESFMLENYFSFVREDDGNYINASYSIVGLDEYYSEEDYIESFLSQEKDYEEYGYKDLKCEGPQNFSVGDRKIKCMTVAYTFDGEYYNYTVNFWEVMDEGNLLQCSLSEGNDSGVFVLKPEESLAETIFSGVTYPDGKRASAGSI